MPEHRDAPDLATGLDDDELRRSFLAVPRPRRRRRPGRRRWRRCPRPPEPLDAGAARNNVRGSHHMSTPADRPPTRSKTRRTTPPDRSCSDSWSRSRVPRARRAGARPAACRRLIRRWHWDPASPELGQGGCVRDRVVRRQSQHRSGGRVRRRRRPTRAYESVIDAYHLRVVDFDIEGASLDNVGAQQRGPRPSAPSRRPHPPSTGHSVCGSPSRSSRQACRTTRSRWSTRCWQPGWTWPASM